MKTSHFPLALLTFITLALLSCNDQRLSPVKVDPAFSSYVSAFTSGVISKESSIRIRLADAFDSEVVTGQAAPSSLISFSPAIEGSLTWFDNQTLEFTPVSTLPTDQAYEGVLHLDQLTQVPETMREFIFQFRTMSQHLEVDIETVKPYNASKLERQYLKGLLRTYDYAENEDVEKTLNATQKGSELPISWTHEEGGKLHYFTVDSISRLEKAQTVEIKWNGRSIQSKQKGKWEEEIPALGDFKIVETRVIQDPEQHVIIRFSDPIQSGQNLEGIVSMQNVENLRFDIEDNELRVYTPFRLSGQRTLEISKGVKNILGYDLPEPMNLAVNFEAIKPEVTIDNTTKCILPSTDGLIFPFKAVNLSAVDVRVVQVYENNIHQFLQVNNFEGQREMKRVGRVVRKKTVDLNPDGDTDLGQWNTFFLDINDIIQTDPGAIYRIEIGFRKIHSLYDCEDGTSDVEMTTPEEEWDEYGEGEMSYWDYFDNYYYDNYYWGDEYYGYNYRERENPCDEAYYQSRRPVWRNILASDLGLIVKRGEDNSVLTVVTDIISTDPLQGVTVELYNYQQKLLASSNTNSEGMAYFEDVGNRPFLMVAKKGKERGYVKMDRNNSVSLSKFDISGSAVQKGIKGFMYGDRGVWRPGDTLFLSFMLQDDKNLLPPSHPVNFELYDSRGQLVSKKVQPLNETGLFSFATKTDSESPTGNWNARVKVGGAVFSKYVKVETIKPNRLKINFDFGKDRLSVSDKKVAGEMLVKWLHGAPARDLKAKVSATFIPVKSSFDRYREYTFDDPVRRFYPTEHVIFDNTIDHEGKADIQMNIELAHRAPGMLKASFNSTVFEKGGEFSVDRFSIDYAPYKSFVGMSLPKGDRSRGMLLTDVDHEIKIATVDADGNPVAKDSLEVSVYKISWRWWWERNADDLSRFEESNGVVPIVRGKASTGSDGRGAFSFQINYPQWGRYMVRIVDPEDGHATGQLVYIDWPGWAGRPQNENPGGASMLVFATDKDKYEVGEMCEVSFPSGGIGRALVSIEDGTKVIHAEWVESEDQQTRYKFEVTPEMTPNVFVNITLVQPHNQTANDLPLRLYGVMPVAVENSATHINPLIDLPNSIRPEQSYTVNVSEKEGQSMTYTLAVVDEGLLDLTRFKTPDAWSHFYAREALGVHSWDIYDRVIGAYGADIEKLLSLGGGGEEDSDPGKNKANRFEPVVRFIGPFTLEKGKTAQHRIQMPNYVGSVRTMVVAKSGEAYGSAEVTTPVKQPLMVLSTLPRVLGPGERVSLPVTVFAMEDFIRDVEVRIHHNDKIKLLNKPNKTIHFNAVGDQVVFFDMEVPETLGMATVEVEVKSGNEVARHSIELDIRNPNPEVTDVIETVLEAGDSWEQSYDLPGVVGTNEVSLELSSIPPIDLNRRLRYLIGYPHGCVEQTTSRAFPQLFLSDVVKLPGRMQQEASDNVKQAILKLRRFQNANGGLSYWPGMADPSDWGTTYAGHFMIEAEKKGYVLPAGFKKKWISYQKEASNNWRTNSKHDNKYDDLAQAYRLYTLALAGKPQLAAMNRLKELGHLTVQAKWRLAAAYQLAGQTETARAIIDNLTIEIDAYSQMSYNFGSNWRDKAMILETLVLMGDKVQAAKVAIELADILSSNSWYSTQTTSYGLMAMSKFAGGKGSPNVRFIYELNGKSITPTLTDHSMVIEDLGASQLKNNQLKLVNKGGKTLFVRIILSGKPIKGDSQPHQNDLAMEIKYLDMNGNPVNVTKLEQGMDFMAKVTVRHPGIRRHYREMALTQIFPSGWEIHNTRMDEVASVHVNDRPTYQDLRDDRVYTYFNLWRNKSMTFTVMLNASYLGKFYLPSANCEAMYDETINARTGGKWVEVIRNNGLVTEQMEAIRPGTIQRR